MHIPRIYINCHKLELGEITLPKDASHHLQKVLRRKIDDPLVVFNGDGGEYHGYISALTKNQVTVTLSTFQEDTSKPSLYLHLGQALTRNEKMDFILQKATELGVSLITPLITEFINIRLDTERLENRLEHWNKIIINAAEQCGRTSLPKISFPCPLSDWLILSEEEQGFLFSPTAKHSLHNTNITAQNVKLLIGPEGGLSAREEELAQQKGFCPLRLGPRILRTETAALAAITVLQFHVGDLW